MLGAKFTLASLQIPNYLSEHSQISTVLRGFLMANIHHWLAEVIPNDQHYGNQVNC